MSLLLALYIFGMMCLVSAGCLVLAIVLMFKSYDQLAFWVRRSLHQRFPTTASVTDSQPPRPGSSAAAIARCLLPAAVVLACFVGFSGAAQRQLIHFAPKNESSTPPVVAAPRYSHRRDRRSQLNRSSTPPAVATPTEKTVAQSTSLQKNPGGQVTPLPEWIKEGDSIEGDVQKTVLSSRLWSSESEATQDLQTQAAELIRADFLKRHPGPLDPKVFKVDGIIESMVKQSHIQQVEQDFGKFTAPMFRAWWQVEISPLIRVEFYPEWKSASLQNRTLIVGVVFSLVTLIASSVELYKRQKGISTFSAIRSFATCTVLVLLWTAFELAFAARLLS